MPPITLLDSLQHVWKSLAASNCKMAVVGVLALSYWGYPRSTRDIDIAILLNSESARVTIENLLFKAGLVRRQGSSIKDLGLVQIDQWGLDVPGSFLEIHVDLLLGSSEFLQAAMSRSVECELFATTTSVIRVLSCEDLILLKAASGRLIDLADIRELKERNRDALDLEYMAGWSLKLGINV